MSDAPQIQPSLVWRKYVRGGVAALAVIVLGLALYLPRLPGALAGEVRDSMGSPVAGARVRIPVGPGAGREALTDDAGRFRISGLKAGPGYALTVTRVGLPPVEFHGLRVLFARTVTVQARFVRSLPPGGWPMERPAERPGPPKPKPAR